MSTPRDPIPEVPGVDDVVRALTTEGDAVELTGRQSALAMFRAVRDESAGFQPDGPQPAATQPWAAQQALRQPPPASDRDAGRHGRPRPAQARVPHPRRLTALGAMAAAIVVAGAGMTAAAYAQILPSPLQDIAHTVLAPIGVPSASPAPAVIPTASSTAIPNVPTPSPTHLSSPQTSCPCPTVTPSAHRSLRLRAARANVGYDDKDTFTGHVAKKGAPDADASVKLLERLSTSPGSWDVIATGATGPDGTATFVVAHIPADATFLLAGSGDLASLTSHEVAVTVTPRLVVRHPARRVLVVTAHPAAAGEAVALERLQDGAWVTVATRPLDGLLSATFTVSPAGTYRFALPATTAHDAGVSRQVVIVATTAAVSSVTPSPAAAPTATPNSTAQATKAPKAKATRRVV